MTTVLWAGTALILSIQLAINEAQRNKPVCAVVHILIGGLAIAAILIELFLSKN